MADRIELSFESRNANLSEPFKVHWHLLAKDAAWIYGEIQFKSRGAREFPDWKIYTSMDKEVTAEGVTGEHPFNNLSILKRDMEDFPFKRYRRIAIMRMQGHVGPIIRSGLATCPGLPPGPHAN